MGLVSAHAFAVHKGGCGKSTLLFHTSCQYALQNPSQNVLVLDMTTLGDISQLFLGGMKDNKGPMEQMVVIGEEPSKSATALLQAAAGAPEVRSSEPQLSGLFSRLRLGIPENPTTTPVVDFKSFSVRVSDLNPNVPGNVFLVSGGPRADMLQNFDSAEVTRICKALNQSFRATTEPWKVFFDTDGDLTFAPYTRIAVLCSDRLVSPLEASSLDFKRMETFLVELDELHRNVRGEQLAKLQLLVWNKIDVYTYKPSPPVSGYLTPTKPVQEKISSLNRLLAAVASRHGGIFEHPVPDDRDFQSWIENSTLCIQLFGIANDLAQDEGIPFCTMQSSKGIGKDKLDRINGNIIELANLL